MISKVPLGQQFGFLSVGFVQLDSKIFHLTIFLKFQVSDWFRFARDLNFCDVRSVRKTCEAWNSQKYNTKSFIANLLMPRLLFLWSPKVSINTVNYFVAENNGSIEEVKQNICSKVVILFIIFYDIYNLLSYTNYNNSLTIIPNLINMDTNPVMPVISAGQISMLWVTM